MELRLSSNQQVREVDTNILLQRIKSPSLIFVFFFFDTFFIDIYIYFLHEKKNTEQKVKKKTKNKNLFLFTEQKKAPLAVYSISDA